MLLRRVSEHLRAHSWTAVAVDLVVVVVGIFIAFQLDRLYEAQRQMRAEGDHIAALTEDFAINRAELEAGIETAKGSIEAVLMLRREGRKETSDLSPEELNHQFALVARLPTFQIVRRAYDELTNSGGLAQLSNTDLRRKLAEFYSAVELSQLVQNTQEMQFVTLLQPYMMEYLDYAAATGNRLWQPDEAKRLDPPMTPELILDVFSTRQFQNLLVAEWETSQDLHTEYLRLLELVNEIEQELRFEGLN